MHLGVPSSTDAVAITFGRCFLKYFFPATRITLAQQGHISQTSKQEAMIVATLSFHVGAKPATLLTLLV